MDDDPAGVGDPPQPVVVHRSGRVRRVRHDRHAESAIEQAKGRLRDADIGLHADQDGRVATGRLDRGEDRRHVGQAEDRLRVHRRPGREPRGDVRVRRPVAVGRLLGHDDRHVQCDSDADEPGDARHDRIDRARRVSLEETRLGVDDDEDRRVPLEESRHQGPDGPGRARAAPYG